MPYIDLTVTLWGDPGKNTLFTGTSLAHFHYRHRKRLPDTETWVNVFSTTCGEHELRLYKLLGRRWQVEVLSQEVVILASSFVVGKAIDLEDGLAACLHHNLNNVAGIRLTIRREHQPKEQKEWKF